jgi:spore coat protein U-like protein
MNLGVTSKTGRIRAAMSAVFALLGLSLFPAQAQAKDSATTSASAQATVVAPLTLVKVTDLNFGRIVPRPTAGTVTVNVNNSACVTTGAIIHQGACQFAEFAGMGTKKMTVRIQVPGTITLIGPAGATMVVDTITLGTAPELSLLGGNGNGLGNGNRRYEIVSNTGIFTFRVAGRLNVNANQRPGVYTGTFNVQVQYQ